VSYEANPAPVCPRLFDYDVVLESLTSRCLPTFRAGKRAATCTTPLRPQSMLYIDLLIVFTYLDALNVANTFPGDFITPFESAVDAYQK
jgi:hypothetical protein